MATGAVGWRRTPGGTVTRRPVTMHCARRDSSPMPSSKQRNTFSRFNHSLRDSTLHQGNYRNEAANQVGR
jgi:hypothetical protein